MQAKDCPRCHRTFGCNMTNITQCQCSKVAIAPTLQRWLSKHFVDCLCSHCLVQLSEIDRIAQIVPTATDAKDMVMKYHYYIDNGKYVFTDLYHYQKDYCCGNKCRHCQYGKSETA